MQFPSKLRQKISYNYRINLIVYRELITVTSETETINISFISMFSDTWGKNITRIINNFLGLAGIEPTAVNVELFDFFLHLVL